MSAFKQGKFYFDDMFSTLWTQTPIHYAGQEFDATGMSQWINPTYRPSRTSYASLSNLKKLINANLYIPCWAENDVEAMELMDDVILFLEENVKSPFRITGTSIIDHGWDDSNKVFGIIMVSIEHTYGICAPDRLEYTCAFTDAFSSNILCSDALEFTDGFTDSFQI